MLYLSTTQSRAVFIQPQIILNSYTYSNFNFKIERQDGFTTKYFSPENFSQSPYYFGFTISVATPESLTGSNVSINVEYGEYHYSVSLVDSYTLTPSNIIIDEGILIVEGTSSLPLSYTASDNDTIKIYNQL